MNIAMTKVMVVDNTPINVNKVLIENVEGYVYLGQHYSLKEKNQDKEIQRRIMAGLAAYAKHRDIFNSKQLCHLHEETGVYNSCVIWCRDLDTDQTSTEQTCGRTDQNGKKYAQHAIHIMLCLGWVLLTSLYCFTGLYIFNPMFAISSRLCLPRYLLCTIFQSSSLPVCLIVLD